MEWILIHVLHPVLVRQTQCVAFVTDLCHHVSIRYVAPSLGHHNAGIDSGLNLTFQVHSTPRMFDHPTSLLTVQADGISKVTQPTRMVWLHLFLHEDTVSTVMSLRVGLKSLRRSGFDRDPFSLQKNQ